jgi:hypothetical protein
LKTKRRPPAKRRTALPKPHTESAPTAPATTAPSAERAANLTSPNQPPTQLTPAESTALRAPYDESRLERARTYWQFGEWARLAALADESLDQHPDRAHLALFAAAGCQQLGQPDRTRALVRQALEWGCRRHLVSQILISGVYHGLGRAALVNDDQPRAKRLLEAAVDVAMPPAEARLWRPIHRLLAQHALQPQRLGSPLLPPSSLPDLAEADETLPSRSLIATHRWCVDVPARARQGQRTVIVIAGMRHSASTALFNIVRLALLKTGLPFVSGYTEQIDLNALEPTPVELLKTHELRDDILSRATIIFTTIRDLRDSVASAKRRGFDLLKKMGVIEYAKYNRQLHDLWAPVSHHEFRYEAFLADPSATIIAVLTRLGLEHVDPETIRNEVFALPTDQYQTTLLSPTHITDPEHQLTYRDTLDATDIGKIEAHASQWLKRHGYLPIRIKEHL